MEKEDLAVEIDDLSGVDELNLAEFPIGILSQRPVGSKITYVNTLIDKERNEKIERSLTLQAPEGYQLPSIFDSNVILALLQLKDRISEDGTQEFSLREVARIMGISGCGANTNRIKKALDIYFNIDLEYKNAWYDRYKNEWRSVKFRVINLVEFGESGQFEIQWGKLILRNIKTNYLKPLDMNLFRALKKPMPQTLFRFLDKKLHTNSVVDYNLETLVFSHLGFPKPQKINISDIKKRLAGAIAILEDFNIISRNENRFYKKRREWRVTFSRSFNEIEQIKEVDLFSQVQQEEPKVVQRMRLRGFSQSQIEKHLEKYGQERVEKCFEIVLFRMISGTKIKNFPGYFSTIVEDDPPFPVGFTSEADRVEKERIRCEEKDRQLAEEEEQRKADEKIMAQTREQINNILDSLGDSVSEKLIKSYKIQGDFQGTDFWYIEVEEALIKEGLL